MKTIGIYKITSPSGKVYIGQSKDIEKRFKQYLNMHPSGKNQIKLWRSFKKYNVENHTFEIVEECEFNKLNIKERYWQDYYKVIDRDKGLNLILTKTNEKPKKYSLETREKMSKSAKGKKKKPFSEKHIANLSTSHIGNNHSEETKIKISKSNKGKRGKKLVDTVTKETYSSVQEASEKLGIKYGTLRAMLNGQNKNKTNLKMIVSE